MTCVPVVPTPLCVYAGDPFEQSFVFRDSGTNDPEDMSSWSGWECHWRVRVSSESHIPLEVDMTDAAAGIVTIRATSEQTRQMEGPGVFDLQASSPSVRTFLRGSTSWEKDVTRDV